MPSTRLLNSWKEVAAYLSRGVRTVQRWEQIGLPVRRVHDGPRAPIVALADDLDRWIRATRTHETQNALDPAHLLVRSELQESLQHARNLRSQTASLRRDGHEAIQRLLGNLTSLQRNCGLELEFSQDSKAPSAVTEPLQRKSA